MELCWWTVLSSIFKFGQISKFKKGHCTQKTKIESEFPVDMHLCTLYVLHYYKISQCSVVWFQRNCTDNLFSVESFILVNFLSSKRVWFWEKKMNQNFLWIWTSTHYVLLYYQVSLNSVEWFQRSCADK